MILPTLDFESKLWKQGYSLVCGVDEVGRGCFAGPVVAGAVIFPVNCKLIKGVADSKLLKPKQREDLSKKIQELAVSFAVGEISVEVINEVGIGKATQLAYVEAIKKLLPPPEFILIDAFYIKEYPEQIQNPIKNGDKLCASVSAASIIAKVYRDNLMRRLHEQFPEYNFYKHKGYGTKEHQAAIKKHGLCSLHRRSFNLKKFL